MDVANCDKAIQEPSPSHPLLGFVDFPHPRAHKGHVLWIGFAAVFFAVFFGGLGVLGLLHLDDPWLGIWIGFCSVGVVVAVLALAGSIELRQTVVIDASPFPGIKCVLARLFPEKGAWIPGNLEFLVKGLVRAKQFGQTIRVCAPGRAAVLQPIAFPHEAVALVHTDVHFHDLELSAGELESHTKPTSKLEPSDDSSRAGGAKRNLLYAGGVLALLPAAAMFAFSARRAYLMGRVTFDSVVWGALFLLPALGLGGRGGWTTARKWSLLPGAVIVEYASWFRATPRRDAFVRAECVLVVHQHSKSLWTAYAADKTRTATVKVTEREAIMLLRTWLSPVSEETTRRLIEAATG